MRKKAFLSFLIVFFVFTAFSQAATTFTWTNGDPTDNRWDRVDNWDQQSGLPSASNSDIVEIRNVTEADWPLIETGVNASCRFLFFNRYGDGDGGLLMTGGNLDVSYKSNIPYNNPNNNAEFKMSGGTANFASSITMATAAGCNGYLNLSGDAVFNFDREIAGGNGNTYINVSGDAQLLASEGTENIELPYGAYSGGTSYIRISDNGLVDIGRLEIYRDSGYVDISDNGVFKVDYFGAAHDPRTFDMWLENGFITAYNDPNFPGTSAKRAAVNVELDGDTTIVTAVLSEPNELAYNPSPIGRTVSVLTSSLAWSAGEGEAFAHDVYFGTDANSVENADTGTAGIYRGQRPAGSPSYFIPEGLSLGETYYWRIDEVGASQTYPGKVWSFVVESSSLIDNFESYDDTADMMSSGGWSSGGDGVIALSTDIAQDTQALAMTYDNDLSAYYSSACLSLPSQNWTANGFTAVDISLRGLAANGADQIYVKASDGTNSDIQVFGVDGLPASGSPDTTAVQSESWTTWHVKLSDFDGVNVTQLTEFCVGVGDPDNPVSTDVTGTIYIDDIILYQPRCLEADNLGNSDLNGDCEVDIQDLQDFVEDWTNDGLF
jgi:hypothetical protein